MSSDDGGQDISASTENRLPVAGVDAATQAEAEEKEEEKAEDSSKADADMNYEAFMRLATDVAATVVKQEAMLAAAVVQQEAIPKKIQECIDRLGVS